MRGVVYDKKKWAMAKYEFSNQNQRFAMKGGSNREMGKNRREIQNKSLSGPSKISS